MEGVSAFYAKLKTMLRDAYENTISQIIRSLFSKPVSVLFLGIDNAGKTTLLNKLKNDTMSTFAPTHHSNKAEVEIGRMKVVIIDLGGHKVARMAWENYFFECDGIVFIVDVDDSDRFEEVREAFNSVRDVKVSQNKICPPIAVLFNKIDKVGHDSESAEGDPHFVSSLANMTGIEEQGPESGQAIKVSYVSIKNESPNNLSGALVQSFQWLETMISYRPTKQK